MCHRYLRITRYRTITPLYRTGPHPVVETSPTGRLWQGRTGAVGETPVPTVDAMTVRVFLRV